MTEVIVSPRARQQVVTIDAWWRENRAAASELFLRTLEAALGRLAANPLAGPRFVGLDDELGADFEVRRLLLRRCRYHVYYRFDADLDQVDVLAIWHTSRGHGPDLE